MHVNNRSGVGYRRVTLGFLAYGVQSLRLPPGQTVDIDKDLFEVEHGVETAYLRLVGEQAIRTHHDPRKRGT